MTSQENINMDDPDSSDEDSEYSDPDIADDVSDEESNDPQDDGNGQDAYMDETKTEDDNGNSQPDEQKRNKIAISGDENSVDLTVSGFDIEIQNDGKRFKITGDNNTITMSGENNYILVIGENNQIVYPVEGNHEIKMEGQGNTATGEDTVAASSDGIIHIKPNNGGGGVGIVDRIRGIFGANPPTDGNGNGPNITPTSLGIAPITATGPMTRRRARLAAQMGDGDAPSKIPRNAITTARASTSAVDTPSQEATNDRRSLVEQQNKEYQDSLEADQEKERIKQEKLAAEEKVKAKQEEIKKLKAEALARLPAEPAEDESSIITLAFRFPNGQLVRRNFRLSDTLSTVQDFVLSRDETPVPFEIIQYPNKPVAGSGEEPEEQTLGEFGINSESLHVRQQTDDSGEDDNDEEL